MYRIEAWSQGDGAMWALGTNGGAEVRTEGEARGFQGPGANAEGDEDVSTFDFEESDLELVASY
ncbi:hypothetical protein D7X74_19585 [Corallococcus sp. CA047B]|uniref:hypothetical protein n=1 Tax=Corallococcus sp. CA047B TaxID=2316729 RepID=UPI000EA3EB1B|nr:hypothetical protein [Corallococcus sp. CA047B]RKH14754.1 hypothetical protein D7X74_19585 [Corallococcus sp. CA047B]